MNSIKTLVLTLVCCAVLIPDAPGRDAPSPIDLSPFRDGIHHWRMKYGRDRNDALYDEGDVISIANNMLRFQCADGGWPKNIDWLVDLAPDEVRRITGSSLSSTFDNRNTYSQIEYLSKAYAETGDERYRDSAESGLEYILREQRDSGGWRGSDVDAITFNDDVMAGIMNLLLDIRQGAEFYDWVNDELRSKLDDALNRAIDATLRCQIVSGGVKTAWCQQHDHASYQPVKARTFELAAITAGESVGVARFLMRLKNPSPEVIEAVECAAAWFERSKIEGVRVKDVPIDPVRFEHHTATFNRVVVDDPSAPPVWARYYEIETNRPFFCNRDGIKVYRLADVDLERRTGYAWYGTWPAALLKRDFPKWKQAIQRSRDGLSNESG